MNSKQVSEMFNLSIDTLRYYEKVGVIPAVTRNKQGYRDYQTSDLNWIFLVKTLRKAGMTKLILYKSLLVLQKSMRRITRERREKTKTDFN